MAGWSQEVGVILIFLGITEVRVEKSSSLPPPDHLQVDPANAWALVVSRNRRERRQRVGTGLVVAPSPLSENRGPTPPCWSPAEEWSYFPSRKEKWRCSRENQLRAGSSHSPLDPVVIRGTTDLHSPAVTVGDSALGRRNGPLRPKHKPVAFFYVECPNFSAAVCKKPKAVWCHLLLTLSKEGSPSSTSCL